MKNSNKFYNVYLVLSMLLFAFMFLTGITDEKREYIDNECFLFLLLLSTLNVFGSIVLYCFHQYLENKNKVQD